MKNAVSLFANGERYNIPQDEVAKFRETADASGIKVSNGSTYRTKDGETYTVPDEESANFRKAAPDAVSVEPFSMADGSTKFMTMPEVSKFLRSKEYRESADYDEPKMGSPALSMIGGFIKGLAEGAFAGGNAAANKIAKALPEVGVSLEKGIGNILNLGGNLENPVGNFFLRDAENAKKWLDEKLPSETKDWTGYEDWSTKTADKFGEVSAMAYKFAPAMATGGSQALVNTIFASDGVNAASDTYKAAIANGFSPTEANSAAGAAFLINFYGAKALTKAGGIGEGIENPLFRFMAGGAATAGVMGAQGAGNQGLQNVVEGRPITEGMPGAFGEGAVEGAIFHGINALPGAVLNGARAVRESREAKEYRKNEILNATETPDGSALLDTLLPKDGLEAAIAARAEGKDISRKVGIEAGLPDNMSAAERTAVIDAIIRNREEAAKAAEKPTPEELKKPEPVKPVIEAQVEKPVEEGKTGEEVENRATSTEETPKTVVSTEEIGEKPTETTKIVPDGRGKMVEKTESRQSDENGPTSVPPEKGTTSRPDGAESGNLRNGESGRTIREKVESEPHFYGKKALSLDDAQLDELERLQNDYSAKLQVRDRDASPENEKAWRDAQKKLYDFERKHNGSVRPVYIGSDFKRVKDGKGKIVKKPVVVPAAERTAATPEEMKPLKDAIAEAKKSLADKKGVGVMVPDKKFSVKIGTTEIKFGNTKQGIEAAERMSRKLETVKDWMPKEPSNKTPAAPKPLKVASGKNVGMFDDVAPDFFAGKKDWRSELKAPIVKDGYIYATDGHTLIRMKADVEAKNTDGAPDVKKVFEMAVGNPTEKFKIDASTESIPLEQARAATNKDYNGVEIWRSPEGKIVMRAKTAEDTSESSAAFLNTSSLKDHDFIGKFDPDYIEKAFKTFAKLGVKDVDVEWKDPTKALYLRGGGAEVLVMPMHGGILEADAKVQMLGGRRRMTDAQRAEIVDQQVADAIAKAKEKDPKLTQKRINEIEEQIRDSEKLAQEEIGKHKGNLDPMLSPDKPLGERVVDSAAELDRLIAEEESGKAASDGEGAAGMISRSDSWQEGKGTSGVFNRLVSKNTIIGRAKKLFPEFAFRGENTTKIGKNYSGHWEPWRELIRSKDMSSIDTIPHEVGHGIDSLTRKAGMLVPQDVKRDLVKLGRQLYGNKRPNGGYMGEGFAEYVRGRMTGADNLATECPSLDKWFNTTFAKRFPKYLERIDTLRDEVLRYRQQTDLQKVAAFMKPSTTKIERTMDAVKSMFTQELWNDEGATLTKGYKKSGLADLHEWRQDFRDLQAAVKAGDTAKAQTLAAKVSEKITTDPRIFASNARGTSKARTMEMFRSGVTDINGVNRIGNVTGFDAAGKPIRDNVTESYRDIFGGWSAKKLADWDSYAAAKVGLENYHKNGLPFGLSLKECENAVRRLETPEFESALSRFTDLTRRALSVGLDVGAITPDQYKAITGSHKYYVRIERRFEENAGGTGGGQANPLHKIKGSSRNIIPPRAATMMQVERQLRYFQTMNVINMMGRDVLAAEKANTLHEKRNSGYTGRTYQIAANVPVKVANVQGAVKFTSEKLKKDFVARKAKAAVANGEDPTIIDAATGKPKVLSDAERLYEDMFGPDGDILTVFREKPSNGKNGLVSTYIDGKLVTFEIPDAAWEKYITGMEKDSGFKNKWAKAAWDTVTAPSKTLRLGATVLNTAFGTANLTRDTFHSAITSEGGQVPVASTALGVYKLLSGKDSAKLFKAMGGDVAMFQGSSLEKQYQVMARALSAEGLGQKLQAAMMNPFSTALRTIADVVSVPEMGPRVQEFDLVMRKAREAGLSEEAAAQLALASAKDVSLDFGKSGKVMRRLNQLMPYTNAWYRGLEQVARKMGVLDALPTEFEERKDVRFRRTVGRGLLWITLPAVATALAKMATSDDEEKRAIFKKTPREKWDFDDSLGVRLAQPFEFGALFSAIPKAMVYESYGDKGAVKEALWHGIETNLLRYKDAGDFTRGVAAISPFIDIALNEKWDKAPLVSPHIRDNMPKKDWKDYSTTKVAELVGEKMDWAPAYIDHIANTYTGGMWKRFLSPAADNSVMTMTGLSTFRPRPTSRRDVQEFYEFSENARRNYNGGDIGLDDLGKLKRAEKLKDELSDDFKEARALNAQGLSTDERNRRREAIMDRVFKKIRDWEGGGSNDRSVGIAKAAIALTNSTEIDESTKRKNLAALKDVTFAEVRDAIVAYGHEKVPKLNSRGKKTGAMRYRWDKDTISKRVRAAKRVLDKERSKTTD